MWNRYGVNSLPAYGDYDESSSSSIIQTASFRAGPLATMARSAINAARASGPGP